MVVVGGFSNIRHTGEHAYGEQLQLWRQGDRLLGLFMFTEGLPADFHTGLLEEVSFDPATGRLSFEAYASQFRFEGAVGKEAVTGLLTRFHPTTGKQISADRIVLKRSPELAELMSDYPSAEEWKRDADDILKRRGPRK